MIRVIDASFLTTATRSAQYPEPDRPEVAFVGRSNVGKSSMINTLAGRKKLVRVSNTPGRTRTLNFFDVTLEQKLERFQVRLCDLPGYGYAKASKSERGQWHQMISTYLHQRQGLKVVVCIIDGEVGATSDDLQMLDTLQEAPAQILVAATKIDRLAKTKQGMRVIGLANQLELPHKAVIGFSSTEKLGVNEVWESLLPSLI